MTKEKSQPNIHRFQGDSELALLRWFAFKLFIKTLPTFRMSDLKKISFRVYFATFFTFASYKSFLNTRTW